MKTMLKFRTCLATIVVLWLTVPLRADPMLYSGMFSGDTFSPSVSPDPFSGSWSFLFDPDTLSTTSFEFIANIPLTSLTLSPPTIGSTVFDTTNTFGGISNDPGSGGIFEVLIYGAPNGSGASSGTDDFTANYDPSTGLLATLFIANVGTPASFGNPANQSGSFTISAVPEPSAFLFGSAISAMIGVGCGVRRKFRLPRV